MMPRVAGQTGGRPSRQAVVMNMARDKSKTSPMKYVFVPMSFPHDCAACLEATGQHSCQGMSSG